MREGPSSPTRSYGFPRVQVGTGSPKEPQQVTQPRSQLPSPSSLPFHFSACFGFCHVIRVRFNLLKHREQRREVHVITEVQEEPFKHMLCREKIIFE